MDVMAAIRKSMLPAFAGRFRMVRIYDLQKGRPQF
jgi:hypothetical protein